MAPLKTYVTPIYAVTFTKTYIDFYIRQQCAYYTYPVKKNNLHNNERADDTINNNNQENPQHPNIINDLIPKCLY